jgi:hypothetical protein
MSRSYIKVPNSKAVPANSTTTVQWTSSDFDPAGAVRFQLILQQTAGTLDLNDVSRVKVKQNGQTIVDATVAQIQAMQERLGKAHNSDLITDRVLNIPLNLLDGVTDDDADKVQIMPGAACTVEVVFATDATGAGIAFLQVVKTDQPALFYPTYIGTPLGVAGAVNGRRIPISAPGIVQGWALGTADVREVKLILSGVQVGDWFGGSYNDLSNIGDGLQAAQALEDCPDDASNVTGTVYLKESHGYPASTMNSYLELSCDSDYTADREIAIFSLVPIAQPQAA